jgi:hypothetical protein
MSHLLVKGNERRPSAEAIPIPSSDLETHERAPERSTGGGSEGRKEKLSYSKKQVEKLIAEAVESSKEIDQRTIKEMIKEIKELNSTIKLQEQRFQQCQQEMASIPSPPVTSPASVSPPLPNQRAENDVNIWMTYSFLLGSLVMLFVSTLFPWLLSHGSSFLSSLWNFGESQSSSSTEASEK